MQLTIKNILSFPLQNKEYLVNISELLFTLESVVKSRSTALVKGFRQSVPYLNAHRGKTFVVMLGGETIQHNNFSSIIGDLAVLNSLGIKIVLVYGARMHIDESLHRAGIESSYYNGIRVTDSQTLEIIKSTAGALQLRSPLASQWD